MRNELDVLNRNIVVPGCEFGRVSLTFSVVDADTLAAVGACLQEMDNCGDWWVGDFLNAWVEWRIAEDGESTAPEDVQEKMRRHFVRTHPSVLNGRVLAETQIERYKVARFYNCGSRLPQLSNEHHREAMDASAGDLTVAQEWLEKAVRHSWSKQELRAQIKSAKRRQTTTVATVETLPQQELFAFNRWSRVVIKHVPDMEREDAAALRKELEPAAKLIAQLDARLAGPPQSL
jgi:hypothetical protein